MAVIAALSDYEIDVVSGGETQCEAYTKAAMFWEGVVAAAVVLGQVEIVIAAGAMAAYNEAMAGQYCS